MVTLDVFCFLVGGAIETSGKTRGCWQMNEEEDLNEGRETHGRQCRDDQIRRTR